GVTFSTYGSGRATINSGGTQAIKVSNTAGITVSNLVMNGSGMYSNRLAGIYFQINASGKKLSNVHISNVEIKNYGHEAIEFDINGKGGSSVSNVKIEYANLHNNLWGGISTTAGKHLASKNWTVQYVSSHDNPGTRSLSKVTGSGIYLADIDGALIQHCLAYNNGKDGDAPVGIWVAGSS